jgi:osmotically-inducible protein OsmY
MKNHSTLRFAMHGICAALAACTLGGCVPLFVGGAVMTGMIATDRRTSGTQLEDQGIELRATHRLQATLGERVHVDVNSYNRQVLLTGEVPSAEDRTTAEQVVSGVENVRLVVNELAVMSPTSLSQRSGDAVISGRVRAALLDTTDISANAFTVTTERGTVYLMGRVTQREADRATEVVRGVGSVLRVVRVLEYITEADLQRMQAAAQPTKSASAAKN